MPTMSLEGERRREMPWLLSLPSGLPLLPSISPAYPHAREQRKLGNALSCNTEQRKSRTGVKIDTSS